MEQKKYLSVKEAAQYTGFSTNHLYRLVSRNAIPHYSPTGRHGKVLFKCEELQTWIERGGEDSHDKGQEFMVIR